MIDGMRIGRAVASGHKKVPYPSPLFGIQASGLPERTYGRADGERRNWLMIVANDGKIPLARLRAKP